MFSTGIIAAPLLAVLFPWHPNQSGYFLKEALDTFHVALFEEVGACERNSCGHDIGDLANFWVDPKRWPVLHAYMVDMIGTEVLAPRESVSGERKPPVIGNLARVFDDLAWLADAHARRGESRLSSVFAPDRPPGGGRNQVDPEALSRAYRTPKSRIPPKERPERRSVPASRDRR
jgi:hypothetical protein